MTDDEIIELIAKIKKLPQADYEKTVTYLNKNQQEPSKPSAVLV